MPPHPPRRPRILRLRPPRRRASPPLAPPPRPVRTGVSWSFTRRLLLLLGGATVLLSSPVRSLLLLVFTSIWGQFPQLQPVMPETSELFTDLDALGVVAIGHAEGNLTVTGDRTAAYWGHADPANQRQNQGWCSDQGRGGGVPAVADLKCLERVRDRLPQITADFQRAGLEPTADPEGIINTVDLYNQASPWVSRQFPKKYAQAQELGKTGEDALVWARVEAFRRNGRIDASGLIGICRREARPVTDWDCVAQDQQRRIQAISRVLIRGSV